MEENNENKKAFDLESELAKIKDKQKNKGGRPPVIPVQKAHEIEELIKETKELLNTPDSTQPKTKEQLIQETYLLITKLYAVWGKDIRTLDPAKVVLQKTPNGKFKTNPVGLTKEDREYLLKSIDIAKVMLIALTLEANPEGKTSDLSDLLRRSYTGISKLKTPQSI